MTRNVGRTDRLARTLVTIPLFVCGVLAPLPLAVRVLAFVLPAAYVLYTAISGTCLGYRVIGRNTCPVPER